MTIPAPACRRTDSPSAIDTTHNQAISEKTAITDKINDEESVNDSYTRPIKIILPKIYDTVYTVVDEMPRFPGCEHILDSQSVKKDCALRKMLEFIYRHLRYPNEACIQGVCVVRFVVDIDGTITNIEILRDVGAGTGEEARRVIKKMNELPKWSPGKQNRQPVPVRLNIPVRFKLQG